ncbi:cytochrome C nitrite reductase, partial [Salmonella enterica subsp. enterica serovar Typhimurium]|nr:cytochrome C nitrite reductase [Salmonella enterica subsp. enterica serovar Typhimurium]
MTAQALYPAYRSLVGLKAARHQALCNGV